MKTTPDSRQINYTYDAVGNRQTSGNQQFPQTNEAVAYSYDDENRLTGVQITQGSNINQYAFAYDPFGRRISKCKVINNTCSETTNYVYDGQNIIMEYDQSGNVTAKYTHGPNIDDPLAVQQGTNTYYYHADGLGSITALSNTSGNVVQTYSYDSFGNITATGNISQPFTYTGREYDSETGMYFYRARYYDPKVGRFVTKDPIGFAGDDVNLYNYVGANSVNRKDPSGKIDPVIFLIGHAIGHLFYEINKELFGTNELFGNPSERLKKGAEYEEKELRKMYDRFRESCIQECVSENPYKYPPCDNDREDKINKCMDKCWSYYESHVY